MDGTMIAATATYLALIAWALAERGRRIRERMERLNADIDAGIARQRELRLKRSQAALKGHQTRRQG